MTETTQPAGAQVAVEQTESQKIARTRIMEMAGFLAAADKFSVTVRAGYDVVQENGQKVEFGEIREISVQRPDRIRIEEAASHGARNLMIFDGKNISILDGETNLYAQAPQPGDIDTSVVYFVRDLKMRLPLAPLLMRHFPQELEKRLQSIDLVEETDIMGQPALHLAGRTASVDFQTWVAEGEQPLPLRIILSYREAEGQPQFWANFSKWNLAPVCRPRAHPSRHQDKAPLQRTRQPARPAPRPPPPPTSPRGKARRRRPSSPGRPPHPPTSSNGRQPPTRISKHASKGPQPVRKTTQTLTAPAAIIIHPGPGIIRRHRLLPITKTMTTGTAVRRRLVSSPALWWEARR